MIYSANPQDAIGAYMVAASDAYDVPINAISQPGSMSVEEVSQDKFRIHNPKERDDHGRFLSDLAVCTYDERTELWTVKLSTGETVRVQATGHDHDDRFVVVAD
jgi:hypothetical protein